MGLQGTWLALQNAVKQLGKTTFSHLIASTVGREVKLAKRETSPPEGSAMVCRIDVCRPKTLSDHRHGGIFSVTEEPALHFSISAKQRGSRTQQLHDSLNRGDGFAKSGSGI